MDENAPDSHKEPRVLPLSLGGLPKDRTVTARAVTEK